MLTIAVVCGAGIATSALLAGQVRDHVEARGTRAQVLQATVMDLLSADFSADLVVSTVDLPDALGIPRVSGMPLLLGTRPEQTFRDIDEQLDRIAARHGGRAAQEGSA